MNVSKIILSLWRLGEAYVYQLSLEKGIRCKSGTEPATVTPVNKKNTNSVPLSLSKTGRLFFLG